MSLPPACPRPPLSNRPARRHRESPRQSASSCCFRPHMSGGHGSGGDGKKVGVWGMVVVGFFWVHGGIYGNEAMLMAGPPLYVFIMLGIVPFVYSLPIALIVAELSTAFPEDGGYVVWVREACGQVLGSHHAYWVWVIYVVDAAIYPVLVANYVNTMIPMGETSQGLLAVAIVVLVTVRSDRSRNRRHDACTSATRPCPQRAGRWRVAAFVPRLTAPHARPCRRSTCSVRT